VKISSNPPDRSAAWRRTRRACSRSAPAT
jgi:hypothetical protein